jgi:hypothetical protein
MCITNAQNYEKIDRMRVLIIAGERLYHFLKGWHWLKVMAY